MNQKINRKVRKVIMGIFSDYKDVTNFSFLLDNDGVLKFKTNDFDKKEEMMERFEWEICEETDFYCKITWEEYVDQEP